MTVEVLSAKSGISYIGSQLYYEGGLGKTINFFEIDFIQNLISVHLQITKTEV